MGVRAHLAANVGRYLFVLIFVSAWLSWRQSELTRLLARGSDGPKQPISSKFKPPQLHCRDASSEFPDHWIFIHMPKAGGTSLRKALRQIAREAGLTLQVDYGDIANAEILKKQQIRSFDPANPARIIMGHMTGLVPLHEQIPVGSTYKYIIMLRSPYTWVPSLYFHYTNPSQPVRVGSRPVLEADSHAATMLRWIEGFLHKCPCLNRSSDSKGRCGSQLNYWMAPPHRKRQLKAHCERHRSRCAQAMQDWTELPVLFLALERFEDSLRLLRCEFGLSLNDTIGKQRRDNVGRNEAHTLTFGEMTRLHDFIETTCLDDIYRMARTKFEQQVSLL